MAPRPALARHSLCALLLISLGSLVACTPAPPPPAPPRAVRVLQLTPQNLQDSNTYSGTLEARATVELAFKVGGRVQRLGVLGGDVARKALLEGRLDPAAPPGSGVRPLQAGDAVRRGQVLAILEPTELRLQARAAQATSAGSLAQEQAARAALTLAEQELARARGLFASGNLARTELERGETAWRVALANYQAAMGQRQARGEQSALAASTVGDTVLRSPLSGLIGQLSLEVGASVSPGRPVVTVLDTAEMRVVFGVPDLRVNRLHGGQPVTVRLEALPGTPFSGTIAQVAAVADPLFRSYAVEVAVPNPEGKLKVGMVASVETSSEKARQALLVPLAAVVRGAGGKGFAVHVLRDKTTTRLQEVSLGDVYQNKVIVSQGVQAGDQVVVEGASLLRDGEKVEVIP